MTAFKAWLKDKASDIWSDLKRAHKSYTQWFNLAVVPFLYNAFEYAYKELPALQDYMEKPTFVAWMLFVGVVNSMLRFKTRTSMANK